jgi:putative membrane protein (TIGR04086 family)
MRLLSVKNQLIRGFLSLIISALSALVLLLFFSLIIYFTGANTFVLKLINLIIRLVAICVCVFVFAADEKGLLFGGLLGILSYLFQSLAFSLLFGGNAFENFLLNGAFSIAFGAIFGIICVNLKNRAKST